MSEEAATVSLENAVGYLGGAVKTGFKDLVCESHYFLQLLKCCRKVVKYRTVSSSLMTLPQIIKFGTMYFVTVFIRAWQWKAKLSP
jgi:hypothetical protein